MLLTIENLKQHLAAKGCETELQAETGQLYSILNVQGRNFPFFARIYDDKELLQFLIFIPSEIKQGSEGELARFLHYINKKVDLPGYCIEEDSRVVFYRQVLPIYKAEVDENQIDIVFDVLPLVCQAFAQPIMEVAKGNDTYSQAIKKLKL